jgi:hypothetical protein
MKSTRYNTMREMSELPHPKAAMAIEGIMKQERVYLLESVCSSVAPESQQTARWRCSRTESFTVGNNG